MKKSNVNNAFYGAEARYQKGQYFVLLGQKLTSITQKGQYLGVIDVS